MAPSLSSLRSSRPRRTRSVDREELDARWGDRSITAPTYQKPAAQPIVPAEWSSPATTMVDSSPDLSFDKDVSPVEVRARGRNVLTITIPLPWKRKSRARSTSPGDAIASVRPSSRDPHEGFVSPEEVTSPVLADALKPQRKTARFAAPVDSTSKRQQDMLHSPRNVDLKSPMFPLSPVSRDRPTRNVDLLTSELDAIALGQKARYRRDLDLTPIEDPSPGLADATQAQRSAKPELRSPVHALTPMVGHFAHKDNPDAPGPANDPQRRPPNNMSPVSVSVRPGQHVTFTVLTPVQEGHERNGQASPNTTSIEASPTSPTVPPIRHSLSTIVITPVDPVVEPGLSPHGYATNPNTALNSHPTSAAPRSRSTSRHDTKRQPARERPASRNSTQQASSRSYSTARAASPPAGRRSSSTTRSATQQPDPGGHRKSSRRRTPAASSTVPVRNAYRRSSDLTTSRRVPAPIFLSNPQKAIYTAYFNRRSRSLEPTPSPRLVVDQTRSPTDSLSSGSTDVDPASDDDPGSSPKDPDRYFEARQMWNGVAGEGKRGFYANVVDDYRMIGKDVSTTNNTENKRKTTIVKPEVTFKKIGTASGEGRVKIAGLDPIVVGGAQQLVPCSEELWG